MSLAPKLATMADITAIVNIFYNVANTRTVHVSVSNNFAVTWSNCFHLLIHSRGDIKHNVLFSVFVIVSAIVYSKYTFQIITQPDCHHHQQVLRLSSHYTHGHCKMLGRVCVVRIFLNVSAVLQDTGNS